MKLKKLFGVLLLTCASIIATNASAEIVYNSNPLAFCKANETLTANATVTLNGSSGDAISATVTIRRCYFLYNDFSQYISNMDVSGGGVFHNGLGPLAGTGVHFTSSGAQRNYFKTYNFGASPAITVKWYDANGLNGLPSGRSFYAINSNNQEFTLTIH